MATEAAVSTTGAEPGVLGKRRVLVVDDEPAMRHVLAKVLGRAGYEVQAVGDATTATLAVESLSFDAVVSDVGLGEVDGVQLLQAIHTRDPDLPVVLVTGAPTLDTALAAVEHGATRYLIKPVAPDVLTDAVGKAIRQHDTAHRKTMALRDLDSRPDPQAMLDSLHRLFQEALDQVWMAYQPVVRWSTRCVFAYEALVRSRHRGMGLPDQLFASADKLGRTHDLGRKIRSLVGADTVNMSDGVLTFVNMDPGDLMDEALFDERSPFGNPERYVLEVTERARLQDVPEAREKLRTLRARGFRIAIDDLGAGHAGLASISHIEPHIVKLDMSLVRDLHQEPLKRGLVRSVVSACQEMGLLIVAEGIETTAERDAVAEIGCDLMQGYLFARPTPPFCAPRW